MNTNGKEMSERMKALRATVRELLADYIGGPVTAVEEAVLRQAEADPNLRNVLLLLAARTVVGEVVRSLREERYAGTADRPATFYTGPAPCPRARGTQPSSALLAGIQAQAAAVKRRFMDLVPIKGGKRIGDCTKGDLLMYAAQVTPPAQKMLARAAWWADIAALMPDQVQVVESVLKEADLVRLHDRRLKPRKKVA